MSWKVGTRDTLTKASRLLVLKVVLKLITAKYHFGYIRLFGDEQQNYPGA